MPCAAATPPDAATSAGWLDSPSALPTVTRSTVAGFSAADRPSSDETSSSSFSKCSTGTPGGAAKVRDLAWLRAAASTATEEASGAAVVQFGMLVTATVTDLSKAAEARAAIDNLAPTARLRLLPVYGSQDSAFAAALPLGLVLPKHIRIPTELREKL